MNKILKNRFKRFCLGGLLMLLAGSKSGFFCGTNKSLILICDRTQLYTFKCFITVIKTPQKQKPGWISGLLFLQFSCYRLNTEVMMSPYFCPKVVRHHIINIFFSSLVSHFRALINSFRNNFRSKLTFVRISLVYSYINERLKS